MFKKKKGNKIKRAGLRAYSTQMRGAVLFQQASPDSGIGRSGGIHGHGRGHKVVATAAATAVNIAVATAVNIAVNIAVATAVATAVGIDGPDVTSSGGHVTHPMDDLDRSHGVPRSQHTRPTQQTRVGLGSLLCPFGFSFVLTRVCFGRVHPRPVLLPFAGIPPVLPSPGLGHFEAACNHAFHAFMHSKNKTNILCQNDSSQQ